MAKLVLLLICAFIPHILTQCTTETAKPRFRRAVYDFSIQLISRLAQEKENHFVASTLSIWTLLASTSLGATGTTLAELKQVLQLRSHKCYNNRYLQLANLITVNNETEVVVEKSSAVFVDDALPIQESFKRKMNTARSTRFESLPFENTDAAAQRINEYVSQATHEVIDEIVSPADLDNVILIIIDAIFFKGSWKYPFSFENTQVADFFNERGAPIGQTNTMYLSHTFNFRYVSILNASVLEIPYGSEERYSMYIFLPNNDVSVNIVIDNLKVISLKTLNTLFAEFDPTKVALQLPRFKITSDLNNLRELLEDMGLREMFDSSAAQFSNLSDFPIYVSNFIQKADIEVTEEGTVASAVTEEEFSFRSGPVPFNINKPFLFMIVDKEIEVPIFAGAYSKPSTF